MSGAPTRVHRAFLGLGGNLGDPAEAMAKALRSIDNDPKSKVVRASSVYRTPPWGKADQPDFLNAVAEVETERTPRELLKLGLDIELKLERVRGERWGPRPIDIDVLWYDGLAVMEDGLTIPHPRMTERAFVMIPLAEIAGDLTLGADKTAEIAARLSADGIDVATPGGRWWREPIGR